MTTKMTKDEFANFVMEEVRKTVKMYTYDVFLDIHAIQEEVFKNKNAKFFWGLRSTGTCIDKDYDSYKNTTKILGADVEYQINFLYDGGNAYFLVTNL